MKKEALIRANEIEKELAQIKKSAMYRTCDVILEFNTNAPYRFGLDSINVHGTPVSPLASKIDDYPFPGKADRDEIQDEYVRFIERVDRKIKKRIAELEKEFESL